MGYNNKLLLEGEKENILSMYFPEKLLSLNKNQYVITDWLSPDDKYFIFLDELYDLTSKNSLGNIWENFDNLKLFLKHSFEVSINVPQDIKESVLNSISKLVITESMSDMTPIKTILRQFVLEQESFGNWVASGVKKTGEWAADQVKEFGGDITDIAKTGWEGLKKAGVAISQGDWKQILDLLGKGMIFFARKLKSLLYNPVGIVLDSILIATGIGKTIQWVPWAIVVALDLYEIITGDYEDKETPTWLRWILIGTDVLGLVFAGGVAGSAKAALSVFKGVKTEAQFAEIAMKNPNTIKLIEKIIGAFSKVPEYLGKAVTYLKSTKLSKAAPWIESILGKAESILQKGTSSLTKITNTAKRAGIAGKELKSTTNVVKNSLGQTVKTGTKAGLKTAATVTGIDKTFKKGTQLYKGISDAEMEAMDLTNKSILNYEKETGKSLGDVWNSN